MDVTRLEKISAFFLDMDGTTYLGDRALPGAGAFLGLLRQMGKRYLWLTNNSSRSAAEWAEKLRRMGFEAEAADVYTSTEATIAYLRRLHGGARLFVLGTESLERDLEGAGFRLAAGDPDFVVVGFDLTLTYDKLRRACHLLRSGVPFIATHPDRTCPTPEGFIPDCGAICALLTEATGVRPKILGKPYPEIVAGALERLGVGREAVAMVGDRLYTDIRMARDAGIAAILVLTGETKAEDLREAGVRPDYVFGSLGDLAEVLRAPPAVPEGGRGAG